MTFEELAKHFANTDELEVVLDSAVNPAEGLLLIRRNHFTPLKKFAETRSEEYVDDNFQIQCWRMDIHAQVQQRVFHNIKHLQPYDGKAKLNFQGEKMRKFEKTIQPGTKVWIKGIQSPGIVSNVSDQRYWIEIQGRVGSFQRQHLERYTNKENI